MSIYDFTPEELDYVVQVGLEKIASDKKNRLFQRIAALPGKVKDRWRGGANIDVGVGDAAALPVGIKARWQSLPRAGKIGVGVGGAAALGGAGYGLYRLLKNRRANDTIDDDVEKVASAYGLDPEELDYVVQVGLEKVADDKKNRLLRRIAALPGKAKARWQSLPTGGKIGVGVGGAAALGGAGYGLYRLLKNRRANDTIDDDVEKVASAYGLDPEELDYVVQVGLEKVADDKKNRLLQRIAALPAAAKARWQSLPTGGKIGVGVGGAAALGGAGYGLYRLLKNRRANDIIDDDVTIDDVEKVASAYGLDPEELDYVVQAGLEKVADDKKNRLFRRIAALPAAAKARWQGLPTGGKIGVGVGGAAALGGAGYGLYRLLKNRRANDIIDDDVTIDDVEKVASAYGLAPEELDYIVKEAQINSAINDMTEEEAYAVLVKLAEEDPEIAAELEEIEEAEENDRLSEIAELVESLSDEEVDEVLAEIEEADEEADE